MSPRNRSLPNKWPFFRALFWSFLHWAALCWFIATLIVLLIHRDLHAAYLAAAALAAVGLTWLFSFLARGKARCPLCKGTPYLNTGAGTHQKAVRIFPLNHALTAMLSTIFTLRFRCMFCGTRYDLLKPSHRKHHHKKHHRPPKEFRG